MRWTQYAVAMLVFSAATLVLTYVVQRLQGHLPWNPQHLPAVESSLALNTAISFTTNTNWQAYTPESTMSYLTQMLGLATHNFWSAAVGMRSSDRVRAWYRSPGDEDPRQLLGRSHPWNALDPPAHLHLVLLRSGFSGCRPKPAPL